MSTFFFVWALGTLFFGVITLGSKSKFAQIRPDTPDKQLLLTLFIISLFWPVALLYSLFVHAVALLDGKEVDG